MGRLHSIPPLNQGDTQKAWLAKQQSQCLRTVLGAYRATPTAQLETEAAVLPLDIYLNSRVAVFQSQLEASGMAELIHRSSAKVVAMLRRRRSNRGRRAKPSRKPDEEVQTWIRRWIGAAPVKKQIKKKAMEGPNDGAGLDRARECRGTSARFSQLMITLPSQKGKRFASIMGPNTSPQP